MDGVYRGNSYDGNDHGQREVEEREKRLEKRIVIFLKNDILWIVAR